MTPHAVQLLHAAWDTLLRLAFYALSLRHRAVDFFSFRARLRCCRLAHIFYWCSLAIPPHALPAAGALRALSIRAASTHLHLTAFRRCSAAISRILPVRLFVTYGVLRFMPPRTRLPPRRALLRRSFLPPPITAAPWLRTSPSYPAAKLPPAHTTLPYRLCCVLPYRHSYLASSLPYHALPAYYYRAPRAFSHRPLPALCLPPFLAAHCLPARAYLFLLLPTASTMSRTGDGGMK